MDDVIKMGFTPYYGSEQSDLGLAAGLQGKAGGVNWDLGWGMGSNKAEYTLYNSLNPDAKVVDGIAQRDFKTGDYEQREMGFNLGLTQELSPDMFLAYGAEYREETFIQSAGEEASHVGVGSSGLEGNHPRECRRALPWFLRGIC